MIIQGIPLISGRAQGQALVTSEPLSFWGGYDYQTGEIIDRRHPLSGQIVAGHVLALPFSRGSSTTTAVLLEAVRIGTAPVAVITTGRDHFFALASIVADVLYQKPFPLVVLSTQDFSQLKSGQQLQIQENGQVTVSNVVAR